MLVLTKIDLMDQCDDPVRFEEFQEHCLQENFQGAFETSSKEWEDFNVHKAFNKTLEFAYRFKYDL